MCIIKFKYFANKSRNVYNEKLAKSIKIEQITAVIGQKF